MILVIIYILTKIICNMIKRKKQKLTQSQSEALDREKKREEEFQAAKTKREGKS